MTLPPEEQNCIFCAIIAGDASSVKVYEDAECYCFMDNAPVNRGHVLVIPREHSRNILTMPPDAAATLFRKAQILSNRVKAALNSDGMRIFMHNEAVANQKVFHTHIHLVPAYLDARVAADKTDLMRISGIIKGDEITVAMDRPAGTNHHGTIYPLNYGFVAGVKGGDGDWQDAYVLSRRAELLKPLDSFTGRRIATIVRADDVETKWVVSPADERFTADEIAAAVAFQEKFFDSRVEMENPLEL